MFERVLILEALERSQRHVAQAKHHVQERENRIAAMERRGHDTKQSRELLKTFRESLRLHVKNRACLRDRLAGLDK